jgi:hypothetical protein
MPTYNIGINFRATAGYVTDATDQTYDLGAVYPVTRSTTGTGQSVTFGWDRDLTSRMRDRNNALDPRLAGAMQQFSGSDTDLFRIDLPASGAWTVRVAAGDTSAKYSDFQFLDSDGSTVLLTGAETSVSADNYVDATNVARTSAADWVSNNATGSITLSGTTAYFRINPNAGVGAVAHLNFYQAASGQTVTSVTGSNVTEASNLVFDVAMSGSGDSTHAYSWGGTSTSADYTQTLTTAMCSVVTGTGTVTVTGSNVFVPGTATAIRITVPTTTDALDENGETVILTLGGTASNTVTIADDDAEPSISGTTSVTVDAGDPAVITYTLSAVSGRTITRTLTVTDGTATGGGTDYTSTITDGMFATTSGTGTVTISGSTVTIPAGVLVFTLSIPTTA